MQKEVVNFVIPELFLNIHTVFARAGHRLRGIHSHAVVEIIKVIKGTAHCTVGLDRLDISEGELLIINRNIGHMLSAEDAVFTYMQVDILPYIEKTSHKELPHLEEFILGNNSKAYLKFNAESDLGELWSKITEKHLEGKENSKRYIKAYLFEMVALMFSHSLLSMGSALSAAELQTLSPIIRYIDTHFHTHITLDDICNEVGYNKYGICRVFKKITGSTVFEYINFVRVSYAADKLKQSGCTMLEITTACGFSSVTYFTRVFKNIIGCTPSAYRKFSF